MAQNSNAIAIAFGAVAVCSLLALPVLSPVSANGFEATTGYLPHEIVNQAQHVEPAIDEHGDFGLSPSFPREEPFSLEDAAPQHYS